MPLRKDIWRPAIVEAPAAAIYERGGVEGLPWRWLPEERSFRFTADPFGLWKHDLLYVFVERFDYRVRKGRIDVLALDRDLRLIEVRPALACNWHLSYPFVFAGEGDVWMLPEAHRSGRLTLYWAARFPDRWERASFVALDAVPVDPTIIRHDGLWWLFYSPAASVKAGADALHAAYAERLAGPWTPHARNPLRLGRHGSRPGGTPVRSGAGLILPVQDCGRTYGGAIRPLRIATLTPDHFDATLGEPITAPPSAAPFGEGLHTIAAAGPVTLVDVKRTILSLHGLSIEAGRHARRWLGRSARINGAR